MKADLREENIYLVNNTKVVFVLVVWTRPRLLLSLGIRVFYINQYRNQVIITAKVN